MSNNDCLKTFFKYCSLNVLGMLGLSFYILADTFFIANGIGSNGLTALNLAIPIYNIIHGTGLMIGIGGSSKFSILHSQKRTSISNDFFTHSIIVGIFFSIIFVFAGLFFSETITSAVGAGSSVFNMTNTYMKIMLIFSPAFILNDILICFIRNDNNPKLSMLGMLIGSISNIILDYIFIFPLNMGIFGAVIATSISPIISIAILSFHIIKKKNNFKLIYNKFTFRKVANIISLGFPSFISEISSGVVIIIFNIIILNISGNVGVAAYGVVANISLVVISIFNGIAQGIQPILCTAYGKGENQNIKAIMKYSMMTLIAVSTIIYIFLITFANPITSAFNNENNSILQKFAVDGLKLYFTSIPFVGFNIIISVYFTSIDKSVPAQVITFLRGLIIIVPVAFILSSIFGMNGVWLAFPFSELLVSIISTTLYLTAIKLISSKNY